MTGGATASLAPSSRSASDGAPGKAILPHETGPSPGCGATRTGQAEKSSAHRYSNRFDRRGGPVFTPAGLRELLACIARAARLPCEPRCFSNRIAGSGSVDKSERLRVLNALVEHIANGTTADAGGIMRVPMSDFTCAQLLAREQDVLFRKTPLCMGLSSALPEPNTYWSDNSTGIPILMVRDGDGQFRAYANICRHRGSLVVPEGRGSKARFTCPFHAWTYGNDGNLLAVNKNRHFGNVSSMDLSLIALPSAELYGTLWVRPTQGDPIDEDECLGGLQDDLIHWKLADHPYAGRQIIDARMNWKLGIDSYGELYHLNVLHPETAGKEVLGNLHTFDRFDNNPPHGHRQSEVQPHSYGNAGPESLALQASNVLRVLPLP